MVSIQTSGGVLCPSDRGTLRDMPENEETHTDQDADAERPSTTSPHGGKTREATTPPGQGDLDEEAAEKSRENLDQAGGGH